MLLAPRILRWFLVFFWKIVCLIQLYFLSVSCNVCNRVTVDQIQKPLNEVLLLLTNQCTVYDGVPGEPSSKKLHNQGMGPRGT